MPQQLWQQLVTEDCIKSQGPPKLRFSPSTDVAALAGCRRARGGPGGLSRHGPSSRVARKAAYSSHLTPMLPMLCTRLAPQMLARCWFRCVLFSLGFHAIFLALNVIPGWLLKNVNFFQLKSHLQSKTKNLFIFPGCQRWQKSYFGPSTKASLI